MHKVNPKGNQCEANKNPTILKDIGSFLEFYTTIQREKPRNKLILLYLTSEDELVGEDHHLEFENMSLLFVSILNSKLAFRAVKLVILRSERDNVFIPTREDKLVFAKLQIFLNLIEIKLKDYITISEETYYSFALDSDVYSSVRNI